MTRPLLPHFKPGKVAFLTGDAGLRIAEPLPRVDGQVA